MRVFCMAMGMGLIFAVTLGGSSTKQQDHSYQAYWQGVKSYRVIRSASLDELERVVSEKLREEWRPIGGISSDHRNYYCQAMLEPN